jgi:hypothetical protein
MGLNFVYDDSKASTNRTPNHRNIDACALRVYTRTDVDYDFEAVQGDIQQFVVKAGRFVRDVPEVSHGTRPPA